MSNPANGPENSISVEAAARLAYREHIRALPRALMQQEWDRYREAATGANKWFFAPIATADANPAVRMCPDVLYSILSIDVTDKPLWMSVPVSRDPFWSLTLIDDNADIYFSVSDLQVEGDTIELMILGSGHSVPSLENVHVVASPSSSGIAIVRTVVPRPDRLKALDRLRRRAKATPADEA